MKKLNLKTLSRNEMRNIAAGSTEYLGGPPSFDDGGSGGRCDTCSKQSDCMSGSACATDIPYCTPGKKCL